MFTRYKSGAEQEMDVVAYVKSGAEQEAEAVYKVKNGAEEEVWSNTKLLDLVSRTTTTGKVTSPAKWGGVTVLTALNDSGLVRYAASGEWHNPTITLDYHGFFYRILSSGIQTNYAGTLYAYGMKANGMTEVQKATTINTYSAGTAQPFSYTFTGGDYVQVGFQIAWSNWNVADGDYAVEISNILIDGQKYITDPNDDY